MIPAWLLGVAYAVLVAWWAAGGTAFVLLLRGRREAANVAARAGLWLIRPVIGAYVVFLADHLTRGKIGAATVDVLLIALLLWLDHSSDDDRWKRLRKRATARVKAVAGRLVVVPTPAPTGA